MMEKEESSERGSKSFMADDKFDEVIRCLQERGWHRVDHAHQASLLWTNLKNVDFTRDLQNVVVNHMKGSQHLSNKAFLAYHLFCKELSLLPVTWSPAFQNVTDLIELLLRHSIAATQNQSVAISNIQLLKIALTESKNIFQDKALYDICLQALNMYPNKISQEDQKKLIDQGEESSSTNVWIIKPVGLSCGEKIEVTRGFYETLKIAQSFNYKCIVQKYIENPLLVRSNRKFDIRQWILVVSLEPLVIYGFSDCYLRLSSKEFSLEKLSLEDKFVHLCNHAIQKENALSEIPSNESLFVCDTMMTQDEFARELQIRLRDPSESPIDVFKSHIQTQIKQISIEAIQSVKSKLENSEKSFEWLGLDLMVTEDLRVKLIEVNVSPDISHSTAVTSPLVKAAVNDALSLLLDEIPVSGLTSRKSFDHITRQGPGWELWYIEEQGTKVVQDKSHFRIPSLRPDCKPLFASSADKLMQSLSMKIAKILENDNSAQTKDAQEEEEDEDDEL